MSELGCEPRSFDSKSISLYLVEWSQSGKGQSERGTDGLVPMNCAGPCWFPEQSSPVSKVPSSPGILALPKITRLLPDFRSHQPQLAPSPVLVLWGTKAGMQMPYPNKCWNSQSLPELLKYIELPDWDFSQLLQLQWNPLSSCLGTEYKTSQICNAFSTQALEEVGSTILLAAFFMRYFGKLKSHLDKVT